MRDTPAVTTTTKAIAASRESFHGLYEAHAPSALRLAMILAPDRETAEDLVQDAFVRLIGRFRDRRGPDAFDRYLRATVINLARSRWRRQRRGTGPSSPPENVVPDHAPGVAQSEVLWQQIQQLPPRQRAALFLRYFEDRSLQDISACLGCSIPATKSLLRYALKNLRSRTGGQES